MPSTYLDNVRILKVIADEIGTGSKPTAFQLALIVGVTPRQIARYIVTLRDDLGAPLPVSHATHGYVYAEPWVFDRAMAEWLARPMGVPRTKSRKRKPRQK